MENAVDPKIQEVLEKIGAYVKVMREESNSPDKKNYKKYAKNELSIGEATYWKIEKGKEYYISSLIQFLMKYPELSLSDFFRKAGL